WRGGAPKRGEKRPAELWGVFFGKKKSRGADRGGSLMQQQFPMVTGYPGLGIGQIVAAPPRTPPLAALGAEVIKLELAPFGDRGRFSGDKPHDPNLKATSQSTYYFQHNHSKKSLAIDIKQERGRAVIYALIPKIDVVVENFAPGVMVRA